jgi:hypothetical protein
VLLEASPCVVPLRLEARGRKGRSQNNESGIVEALLSVLPVRRRYFVEFGIGPADPTYATGLEGNCVDLAACGWHGLFMDGGIHPPIYEVKQEFITADNINDLLAKYGVPEDFCLISIDIDGQDYWVWKALAYKPEIVVIEMNSNFGPRECLTVPRDNDFRWDRTKYYGASLLALDHLGRSKGYQLVYANGVNAFFVRKELMQNADEFRFEDLFIQWDIHAPDPKARAYVDVSGET